MYPEVRVYADPLEGLNAQLTQLRGLIKIVPPLIDADRQQRWDEISSRPSDGEDGDVVDIYGAEAGPEEDWGFAAFDRTIYVAAVINAWAVFHDYLGRQLRQRRLNYDLSEHPPLAALVEDEVRSWDRTFDKIVKRYKDFADVALRTLPGWDHVLNAHQLRNALVHNQGQYTKRYLDTEHAHRPTGDELGGFTPPTDDARLIDHDVIPLSLETVDGIIKELLAFAVQVRGAIDKN